MSNTLEKLCQLKALEKAVKEQIGLLSDELQIEGAGKHIVEGMGTVTLSDAPATVTKDLKDDAARKIQSLDPMLLLVHFSSPDLSATKIDSAMSSADPKLAKHRATLEAIFAAMKQQAEDGRKRDLQPTVRLNGDYQQAMSDRVAAMLESRTHEVGEDRKVELADEYTT